MSKFFLAISLSLIPALLHAADDDSVRKEYAKFTGTWRFAAIEAEGKRVPEKNFKDARLVIEGEHFTAKESSGTFTGTFKVDVAKKPKQIDVTFAEGPDKGKTALGIYELDGETYKVCMGYVGKGRPTAFESRPGSGHVLEVLKRENAPTEGDAAKKELAKLQGTWQLLSAETDGKKLPEEQVKQIRVVIKDEKHTVYFGEKVVAEGVAFKVDPTRSPKEVEDTLRDGRKIRGIYELDGDTLRSCVAPPDKDRPTEFAGGKGSGSTLRVFRRVKP
jgi:uncharacterized protein (TIGR03067 family)